jgi:hypothetical protein
VNQNRALRELDRALQSPRWRQPEPEESSRDRARRRLLLLFDAACPDADPNDSAEQFRRAGHQDIAGLSDDEITSERILLRIRWALAASASTWLTERLARLDGEAAVRRPRRR